MSAVISPCGTYRYRLERDVNAARSMVFMYIGVNPSTADANVDDATVRKWRGFTERNYGGRFVVGNLFGFRATDVAELEHQIDPIGPRNGEHLLSMMAEADVIVPCWGSRAKLPKRLFGHVDLMLCIIRNEASRQGKPLQCFGLTNGGDPKHPLMLGYDTPLVPL